MPVTGMPIASAAVTATAHSSRVHLGGDVVDGAALVQVGGAADPQPGALGQHVVERPAGLAHGGLGDVVERDPGLAAGAPPRGAGSGRRSARARCDRPVPMTSAGRRSAAATTLPSITTRRRSSPGARCSISTSGCCSRARASAASSSSGPSTPTVMPLPCSPRVGLTTTSPTSSRNAWSSSSKVASRPRGDDDAGLGDDATGQALVVAAAHRHRGGVLRQRLSGDDAAPAV